MRKELKMTVSKEVEDFTDRELRHELEYRGYTVFDDDHECDECTRVHLDELNTEEFINHIDDERLRLFAEKMDILKLDQWRAIFNEIERIPKADRIRLESQYTNVL